MKYILRPTLFYGGYSFIKGKFLRRCGLRRLIILLYHKVGQTARPFFGSSITPENFEKHIRFLTKTFHIVDFEILGNLDLSFNNEKDWVILTFDDGYRDNFLYAFPILRKFNAPATVFLATDYIDNKKILWYDQLAWILYNATSAPSRKKICHIMTSKEEADLVESFFSFHSAQKIATLRSLAERLKRLKKTDLNHLLNGLAKICNVDIGSCCKESPMLDWEEVREMARSKITFGSHTLSHPVLSNISESEALREIVNSKKIIEEQLQQKVTTFAYPYGKAEDYSHTTLRILRNAGFSYACTTTIGYERIPVTNPLLLKRKGAPAHPYLLI